MSKLEEKYNLIPKSKVDYLYEHPSSTTLSKIPKAFQTYEMLMFVCKHDGYALKYASKKLITPELCEVSVKQNGNALEYIPSFIFDIVDDSWVIQMFEYAVESNGCSLKYIPEEFINEELVIKAIKSKETKDWDEYEYPILYVPKKYRSHDINVLSVTCSPLSIKNISHMRSDYKELAKIAVGKEGKSIEYIQKNYRSKDLFYLALQSYVFTIKYMPRKYITKELSQKCFERNELTFCYIPVEYITKEMCIRLVDKDLISIYTYKDIYDIIDSMKKVYTVKFSLLPNRFRNDKEIIDALISKDSFNSYRLIDWNESIKNFLSENDSDVLTNERGEVIKPLEANILKYIKNEISKLEAEKTKDIKPIVIRKDTGIIKSRIFKLPDSYYPVVYNKDIIVHELNEFEYDSNRIYYISDIHLEYQLGEKYSNYVKKHNMSGNEARELLKKMINKKLAEMIEDENVNGTLLIGGDVSNNVELTELFYRCLCEKWQGRVVAILGNHELWDGAGLEEYFDSDYVARDIDDIVNDYRERFSIINKELLGARLDFLENELLICYKNYHTLKINTKDILKASVKDLKDLLSKCSLIIFGGIGYSGLDPKYNSSIGLYHRTVSKDEDIERSLLFKRIHDKIAKCAEDKKVIVISHTPVYNWMPEKNCVANWIYISGHTHKNSLCRNENESLILADNQIGYNMHKWRLKAIQIDCWYDPFKNYKDGIYEISSDEYKDFNLGRGIYINGCNWPGTLYMLKNNNLYMFIIKSKTSVCLLVGGQRKKLNNENINYYYENMNTYADKIREIIKPYKNAIETISKEIKNIGGTGCIHGCIVDISFFSHIYLNPYDGKITVSYYISVDVSDTSALILYN